MTENDILGFDPQSLSVFNESETPKSAGNPLIYRTRPAESKSEDGHYRAVIKVVYNPFNPKISILDQQSYSLEDENGFFNVVSSLTVNDLSCPIFKAWKKCRYAEVGSTLWKQAAKREDGGNALFDKRFARYVVIQVLEDKNQPDLVGKFLFWKLPKSIYDLINNKMNPSKESGKASIPVMDYLFGKSIDLEVVPGPGSPGDERYNRETKYIGELSEDTVCCINPDGSPLLNDEEQDILDEYVSAMKKVWREKDPETRNAMKAEINSRENTKKLGKFYNEKVIPLIKSVCPNLIEELSYKEWSDDVKARVQRWIDIVLQGNDPKSINGTAPKTTLDNVDTPATKSTVDNVETKEEDDETDLPF